jgi:flavin-dependent dehydrogenase
VVIVFQERGFQGYLWSFPRVDHASVGIIQCLEDARSADLRRRVNEFIASRYPAARWSERNFFAACVPSLRRATLASQRVCGRNWSLLGDAAGFADAITAEGIFFALRSAELFGTAVAGGNPLSYEDRWRSDFGAELDRAAAWRERFYSGTFLRRTVPGRAIQMIQRSGTIRRMTDSLISGRHSYRHLPSRLLARSPRILAETFRAALSRKHRQQAGKPPAAS